ncbi:DDE-type integrase/transposase/recombinase [Streptomyces sp. IMTB 2501]|uniref:DDE-type integrase/transposase/recombinase n=1 Tax=Streptomyces sp. IMTB 2501 TaxID=1776340 RepID=UPI0009A17EB0|nr:DDE-type integrase/transposase/recombinase [Streptomyces sp. IMTB 2501]
MRYLGHAVGQADTVLDILVQNKRDTRATKRFFRKLLKGLKYVPRVIVTDKLRSDPPVPRLEDRHRGAHARLTAGPDRAPEHHPHAPTCQPHP